MARRNSTFTTFMNVEEDSSVDRTFSNLEKKANASFARISMVAQKAANAANGSRVTGNAGAALSQQARTTQTLAAAERTRAAGLQSLTVAERNAAAASERLAGRHLMESNAARAAAASTSQLERALRLSAVAGATIQGPLGGVAGRLSALAVAARDLTGIQFGAVGAVAGIVGFARLADKAQELKNQLRPLYETQEEVNSAFSQVRRIADDARVGLEPVVSLYSRLTLAGRDAGLSVGQISKLTDVATKAARLSGGPAQSQEAGLYQFSQGLGSGTLAGDELRSVRENNLRLAKAIADGLDVPISKLKELGAAGQLTPKVIADALIKESKRIDEEFAKLPPTISSSTAKLGNAFISMVNGGDEAYGVTRAIAGAIDLLTESLDIAARATLTFAVGWATFRAQKIVGDINSTITALRTQKTEGLANARAAQAAAETQRRASASRIVSLRQERAALQQKVVQERAAANETRRAAISIGQNVQRNYVTNNPREVQAYARAVDAAKVAQDNFAASKKRLSAVSGELRMASGQLVTSTVAYRGATTAAATASRTFGTAMKGLWAAINPVGLAISVGVSLLIQYAFRQSAAARAADELSESQARLADFVDLATGKINAQSEALRNQELAKRRLATEDFRGEYQNARRQVTAGGYAGVVPGSSLSADPRIRAQTDAYARGEFNLNELSRRLQKQLDDLGDSGKGTLAGFGPTGVYRRQLEEAIQRAGNAQSLGRTYLRSAAQDELLAGNNSEQNRRWANGDFTIPSGGRAGSSATEKPKTTQQLQIEARAKAAQSDLQKAQAELARLSNPTNAKAIQGSDGPQAYQDQYQAAYERVQQLKQAEKDASKARTQQAKEARQQTAAQAKAERERLQALEDAQRRGDRRTDILANYDEVPKAIDTAAKQARELSRYIGQSVDGVAFVGKTADEIEQIKETNPLGAGIYTAEMAAADKARIDDGVRRPIRDLLADQNQQLELQKLRLAGYGTEAAVLERMLDLQKSTGAVTEADYRAALANEQAQLRINDALESRERQVSQILGLAQQTRDSFEQMLVGLQKDPIKAIKGFANNAVQNVLQIRARQLTEKIFAGADEKLRDLVTGKNGVDKAAEILGKSVQKTADSYQPLIAANDNLKNSANETAEALRNLASTASGTNISGLAPGSAAAGGGGYYDKDGVFTIDVTGGAPKVKVDTSNPIPSASQGYGKLLDGLAQTLGGGKFVTGITKGIGDAFSGAATGALTNGFMSMLGIKGSRTGSMVGGGLGNIVGKATGIPGLDILGGVAGGLIGGLFKSNRTAGGTITGADSDIVTAGKDSKNYSTATGLAGSVQDQLQGLADSLGATIGAFNVTIGTRGDEFRVNANGGSLKYENGAVGFGDDQEAAVAYAVKQIIEQGAVTGISNASLTILKKGKDLQKSIEKATVIESIPKRLKQMTDPVGYAIDELNTEFSKMISYLKEGGATAQQFADAQKLYELERAEAIKQATNTSVEALQDYLDEMTGGSTSPFNKKTTYENAEKTLAGFRSDIASGKVVDQDDFLQAVQNFQNASRELYGSGSSFFEDFNDIFDLVSKAKDNITGSTGGGTLPGSPFDSSAVQTALAAQTTATTSQTAALTAKLDELIDAVTGAGYTQAANALRNLPGLAA